MEVAVRPLVAPGVPVGTVRAWVGVFGYGALPAVSWYVDGVGVPAPQQVRPLAPAAPWHDRLRAATAVVDLPGLVPGREHRIRVVATGPAGSAAEAEVLARPLPPELPNDPFDSFNVLLVSCFYQRRDRSGRVGALVSSLTGQDRPDLVLTVGDQVYLDVPPTLFAHGREDLAATFEQRYRAAFTGPGGYAAVLRAAPVAAIPDDHEYWNNFPHTSPMTPQTFTEGGRRAWTEAARAMYDAFQLGRPDEYSYRFDIAPLSFLMLDNRTFRDADAGTTMRPHDQALFDAWIEEMCRTDAVPVIATGPSLFQPARAGVKKLMDRNIANYDDYPALMRGLIRLARAGRPVLALTGDVHYGRVVDATLFGMAEGTARPTGSLREIIASPSALVAPTKHARATAPPVRFTPDPASGPMGLRATWPGAEDIRGNNVALLQFRRTGPNVDLRVRYFMIGDRPPYRHHDLAPMKLPL